MPGTGAEPQLYRELLTAAAATGHHVIALSYSSYPFSVGASSVWCTTGYNNDTAESSSSPSDCNVDLHESVLFGNASDDCLWSVPPTESVASRLAAALQSLGWGGFLSAAGEVDWRHVIVSGHSQGASHAAYLSTVRPVAAAVLFSGPQECPQCAHSWLAASETATSRRVRALYSLREACGDKPAKPSEYCASQFGGGVLRQNLNLMGLTAGLVGGNGSGYIVADFEPLSEQDATRPFHGSVAMDALVPPGIKPLFTSLFANVSA